MKQRGRNGNQKLYVLSIRSEDLANTDRNTMAR